MTISKHGTFSRMWAAVVRTPMYTWSLLVHVDACEVVCVLSQHAHTYSSSANKRSTVGTAQATPSKHVCLCGLFQSSPRCLEHQRQDTRKNKKEKNKKATNNPLPGTSSAKPSRHNRALNPASLFSPSAWTQPRKLKNIPTEGLSAL